MKIIFGWPSVYAGTALITIGASLYAGVAPGLIWGGMCLIVAGVTQVIFHD